MKIPRKSNRGNILIKTYSERTSTLQGSLIFWSTKFDHNFSERKSFQFDRTKAKDGEKGKKFGVHRGDGDWGCKKQNAATSCMNGIENASNALWENAGAIRKTPPASVAYAKTPPASVEYDTIAGLRVLSADAGAEYLGAEAGAFINPTAAKAAASANVAQASASAAVIKDVIEANANAEFAKAGASISYSPLTLQLVNAEAGVSVGKASVGVANTPLQAHVSVGEAGGEAGVGWQYTGASIGASVAEAKAGPFGARLGVKFGGGIRNGIPEVDLGPVTTPCSIM